jgi:hypothetical protein
MNTSRNYRLVRGFSLVLTGGILFGCDKAGAPAGPRVNPVSGALAAKSTGVSVTATDPSFGDQGQTNERVTITGTGFAPGAQASWLRSGVTDTTITVTSTEYVSSTTLIATISISPKSPVDFRDVKVELAGGRTQGIGNLLFEVTQAVQIQGTSAVRSINDNGEATGTLASGDGVFYYNVATRQLETVSATGTGYDISPAGTAIVGSGGANGAFPYLYTRTGAGGTWRGTSLPTDPSSTAGAAGAMLTDGTGQVVTIGGIEQACRGKICTSRGVVWVWQAGYGVWQRTVLPDSGSGGEVRHRALSSTGVLGGFVNIGRVLAPAVWMPNGSGGYALTVLSTSGGAVNGVRSDGGMVAGYLSTPVYWLAQPGGAWSAPITIAGGCNAVKDVAEAGRIILNYCPFRNRGQPTAAYADVPYGTLNQLGGLGPKSSGTVATDIAPSGHYAGGFTTVNSQTVGIYWALP